MRAWVVYESMYGNTREIALRIGEGIKAEPGLAVEVHSSGDVSSLPDDLQLLVLGAPTQGHTVEATMRAFLSRLEPGSLQDVPVAVFDTRIDWPKLLSGSAADAIARLLRPTGARLIDERGSFIVEGKEGPLREGEADRAEACGRHLLSEMGIPA